MKMKMKNTTTALLVLFVGSTLTLNASARSLEVKCKVSYSQGQVDSDFTKPTKKMAKFNNSRREHSGRCKKGTNKLIKKANKWLKGSSEDAKGNLRRTITNIQPIECAVEHMEGFAWLSNGYGAYKKCGDKYDNKFKNKLIKKL
jgi:uncharacterized Fe-S cluster protein YjdI